MADDDDSFDLSGDLDDFLNEDSSSAIDLETDLDGDEASVSGVDTLEAEVGDPIESSTELVEGEQDVVEDAGEEVEQDAAEAAAAPKRNRSSLLSSFSIFDAMLVCSLLLVTAAALMMAWGLNDYGTVFGLPRKTSGITVR